MDIHGFRDQSAIITKTDGITIIYPIPGQNTLRSDVLNEIFLDLSQSDEDNTPRSQKFLDVGLASLFEAFAVIGTKAATHAFRSSATMKKRRMQITRLLAPDALKPQIIDILVSGDLEAPSARLIRNLGLVNPASATIQSIPYLRDLFCQNPDDRSFIAPQTPKQKDLCLKIIAQTENPEETRKHIARCDRNHAHVWQNL